MAKVIERIEGYIGITTPLWFWEIPEKERGKGFTAIEVVNRAIKMLAISGFVKFQ